MEPSIAPSVRTCAEKKKKLLYCQKVGNTWDKQMVHVIFSKCTEKLTMQNHLYVFIKSVIITD